MGTKKGRKHFGDFVIEEVRRMKSTGKTNREIAEVLNLENAKSVKNLITRHNKRERNIEAGILPKPKGRPRENAVKNEDWKDNEIKRLRMENDLLRSFHQIAGRK